MADKERMTAEFMELTNADAERANFFLESSGWDVQLAISNFFENGGADMGDEEPEIVREVPAPPHPPAQVKTEPEDKKPEKKTSTSSSSSRIQTLRTLETSEGSSDEEGQAFYAGGSEHSGQQILGPSKKKGDFVTDIFKSIREHGGEEVDPRQASSSNKPRAFIGTGYRLGQNTAESQVIPSTSNAERDPSTALQITIKMWKTGFSIDDGPLREYESNRDFLNYIKNGEVPPELVNQARGREVNVDMEDHHMEDFAQPKRKVAAFAGKGHVLGSPAPATVGAAPAPSGPPMTDQDKESNEDAAKTAAGTDPSQPTTTVQVRLMDGSRLLVNLNHTHTVGDLRRFISIARPQLGQQAFYLRTTFPSAELADDSKTLKEAGLLNAAVLLRLN